MKYILLLFSVSLFCACAAERYIDIKGPARMSIDASGPTAWTPKINVEIDEGGEVQIHPAKDGENGSPSTTD